MNHETEHNPDIDRIAYSKFKTEYKYIGLDCCKVEVLEAFVGELKAENEKLQAFKDYVHKRLDDAGIPVDPESPHKAAGCRIGGRLDIALQLASDNERLKLLLEKCFYKIEDIEDQGPPGYGWQSQDLLDLISSIKATIQNHE